MEIELSTDLSTVTVENRAAGPDVVLNVAIDLPRFEHFDYLPPGELTAAAVPLGARVRVPFGRREAIGFVVGRAPTSTVPAGALRQIRELLDPEPLLDAPLLSLLRWTARYYHHPLGEVISAALPKALRAGAAVIEHTEHWSLSAAGRDAWQRGEPRRAPAQRALLGQLAHATGGLPTAALAASGRPWRPPARALLARGWIDSRRVALPAPAPAPAPEALVAAPALGPAQAGAVARIAAAAGRFQAFVLQGATGSGKSEVYLQCAQRALARGDTVLVLVPEISLTPQFVERVRQRLGCPLAVQHSGLGDAERLAAWRATRTGSARIVLGTRSAVFAPLQRCGLIIVDEEHDASYKQQDGGCRYSARDLAVRRAQQSGIPVVLGSATPAFETLDNVRSGRYQALMLPRRADQAQAPRLALIDLRTQASVQGVSAPALASMREHLATDGQVLVFINRRGYAPTLLCTACGWIAPCEACDARLTVHRAAGELRCHHCGASAPLPQHCLRCGFAVKPVGQGTERVEELLQQQFPGVGLARLDRDTAGHRGALEALMQQVHSGAARILVGTQMVTKGHHFPGLSLVLVLNADQGLFSMDFRAAERLAQTIVQVAGRAGREQRRGEVLIQTEYPDHPLLQSLLAGGYEGFADAGLLERAAAHWPPFGRLALLRASATDAQAALAFLGAARGCAAPPPTVRLQGPVAAGMARRAGRHHAQLLIESRERGGLHRFLEGWLPALGLLPQRHRVRYALDVDPIEIQ